MDIHEFMQGYKTAWERRDPSMFAALFVPDGRCHNTEARIGWHSMPEPPRIDGWLCPIGVGMNTVPVTVDEYIASFPADIRAVLRSVRATIRKAAPGAEERISYRMPAIFQNGVVVYFGAFKNHLGLFPPVEDPEVRAMVATYAGPKGNLQFPYSQPIPHELIVAIVQARLEANLARTHSRRHATRSSSAKRTASRRGTA